RRRPEGGAQFAPLPGGPRGGRALQTQRSLHERAGAGSEGDGGLLVVRDLRDRGGVWAVRAGLCHFQDSPLSGNDADLGLVGDPENVGSRRAHPKTGGPSPSFLSGRRWAEAWLVPEWPNGLSLHNLDFGRFP